MRPGPEPQRGKPTNHVHGLGFMLDDAKPKEGNPSLHIPPFSFSLVEAMPSSFASSVQVNSGKTL